MKNGIVRSSHCDECGCRLEIWDEAYYWTEGRSTRRVCGECFDALFDGLSRYEKAMLIGSPISIAGEVLKPS